MGREPPKAPRPGEDRDTPNSGDTPTELYRAGMLSGPIKGATIANKYRLDKLIAVGGMGSVWQGHDKLLERNVAIKFMDPAIAGNEVLRRRFTREAKSAAKLSTPHVVQIIEFGVDDEVPFIVMELLDGEDLQKRLKRERRIPKAELIPIAKQIAKGLRAAHEAGVVHRDLKPQNVFLAKQDDDVVVKVLDFGVAKMTDAAGEGTKAGVVVGSPHYMSPEQARGLPTLDGRSDLWSLAVILFKSLTGHRPFKGDVAGDIIVKICAEPIPLASSMRKSLGKAVDDFFIKALQREPEDRFQNAIEMTDAFARAVYADKLGVAEAAPSKGDSEATERRPSTPSDVPADDVDEQTGHAGGTAPLGTAPLPIAGHPGGFASAAEASASGAETSTSGAEPGSVSGAEPSASGAEGATGPSFPTPGGTLPNGTATPSTGASMPTGFAGSLPTGAGAIDDLKIQRNSPSVAVIGGIAAGALLFIVIVAMAMSGDTNESGDVDDPEPASSHITETPWGPVTVPGDKPSASSTQVDTPPDEPEIGTEPAPSAPTTAEPSASPSASTPAPSFPRPIRRRKRRKTSEDWGY